MVHPRHLLVLPLVMLSALALGSCRTPESTDQTDAGLDAPTPPPSAEAIIEQHQQRLEQLPELRAHGVIEIRWRDEQGRHLEQTDVDLWIDRPDHLAMRGSKLGEPLFWLGANPRQYWIFDLLQDETFLLARPTGSVLQVQEGELAISIRPRTLLDLIGLTEWTPASAADELAPVTWNPEERTWDLRVTSATSHLRIGVEPTGERVVRIELLEPDEDGEWSPALISRLDRFHRVEIPSRSVLAQPFMPTNIDIVQPGGSTEIKLALSRNLRGDLSGEPTERLFDLDTIQRALQPDEIDRIDPATDAEAN